MRRSAARGGRLDQAFYVLAVFELLTVAGALYLAHQMTAVFDESLAANRAWQQRVRMYAALDHAITDARPPLDELFVSEHPASERQRFAVALAAFERLSATARHFSRHLRMNPLRRVSISFAVLA